MSFDSRAEPRFWQYEMPIEQNHYFKAITTFAALTGFRPLRSDRLAQGPLDNSKRPDAEWR